MVQQQLLRLPHPEVLRPVALRRAALRRAAPLALRLVVPRLVHQCIHRRRLAKYPRFSTMGFQRFPSREGGRFRKTECPMSII